MMWNSSLTRKCDFRQAVAGDDLEELIKRHNLPPSKEIRKQNLIYSRP